VASALSIADAVAVLYGGVMRHRPDDPGFPDRDRFILSKGHAGAIVYAALAESGYFPVTRLAEHCANGSALSGHVSHAGVPGVELSTGSLGHGLSVAAGMALQAKRKGWPFRTYVAMGDGECAEGSVWEAAQFAAHHHLSGLVAIIDANRLQGLGRPDDVLACDPMAGKWRAFGWSVVEVDGHDHEQLEAALDVDPRVAARPRCVLAHTIKGKGVSFMEDDLAWHYRSPGPDELTRALAELGLNR
jgi:transketolase